MGKKKRRDDGAGEATQRRIFCYYCDRNFDDEKVLILHQKARHFKCPTCHKKLSTISGMIIHTQQVHKETLKSIPNAKPGKESVEVEVYGMEGVPDADGNVPKKPRLDAPIMGGYPGRGVPFIGGRPPPPMRFRRFPGGVMPPPRMAVPQGYPPYAGVPQQWARGPPPVVPPPQAVLGYPSQPTQMGLPLGTGTPQSVTVSNTNVFDGVAQKAVKNDLGLVYADENVSMEEKRALRPKYAYKPLGLTAATGGSGVA
ncbi:Zinc finger, C2H2-like [Phytophthora cactorum]|nr:Zinc finger, C2H2-like [Phytophthora cactorum]